MAALTRFYSRPARRVASHRVASRIISRGARFFRRVSRRELPLPPVSAASNGTAAQIRRSSITSRNKDRIHPLRLDPIIATFLRSFVIGAAFRSRFSFIVFYRKGISVSLRSPAFRMLCFRSSRVSGPRSSYTLSSSSNRAFLARELWPVSRLSDCQLAILRESCEKDP